MITFESQWKTDLVSIAVGVGIGVNISIDIYIQVENLVLSHELMKVELPP